jgi:hypothetical protein
MDGTKLVDTKDEVLGVSTGVGTGESFRGKANGEGNGRGVRANGVESSMDFGRGIGGDVVHRDNEGAEVLAFGTALVGTESRGKRAGANIGDVGATADGAAGDFESKRGRVTRELDGFSGEAQERVGGGDQRQRWNFVGFSRDVGTLGATKVFDVGRSRVDITHSFIETDVDSSLDAASFEVEPDNIFRGVRGIAEEDASSGMEGELGRAFARGTDPYAAAEGAEIGKVVLVLGATRKRGVIGALDRESIVDAKVQIESVGPKFSSESTTE